VIKDSSPEGQANAKVLASISLIYIICAHL